MEELLRAFAYDFERCKTIEERHKLLDIFDNLRCGEFHKAKQKIRQDYLEYVRRLEGEIKK